LCVCRRKGEREIAIMSNVKEREREKERENIFSVCKCERERVL
jgi:hypothetical protein